MCIPECSKRGNTGKLVAFVLTFLAYMGYHLSRKSYSVIKASLAPKNTTDPTNPGWDPFVGDDLLLGATDSVFLGSYALALFAVGAVAHKYSLKVLLVIGCIGSGAFVAMFGAAWYLKIHSVWWFVAANMFSGLFQATGWPCVVGIMGNWFGEGKRGLVMGLWNSHTSIGNIVGNQIAGKGLNIDPSAHGHNWGMATILCGIAIGGIGLILWCFLVVAPDNKQQHGDGDAENERTSSSSKPVAVPSTSSQGTYAPPLVPPGSAPLGGSSGSGGSSSLVVTRNQDNTNDDGRRGPTGRTTSAPHARTGSSSGSRSDNEYDVENQGSPIAPLAPEEHRLANSEGDGFEDDDENALTFLQAVKVPGVIPFSLSLFFAKLVAYSMLFWLPKYLTEVHYNDDEAAQLASFFDIGGIAGGIATGFLSDRLKKPAIISVVFLLTSIPVLVLFRWVTDSEHNTGLNIFLMMLAGVFINGPYALITTAVSADLGSSTKEFVRKQKAGANEPLMIEHAPNAKSDEAAIALVTGIIDGTGSLGAAVQGVAIGLVLLLSNQDWGSVFYMLMACCLFSCTFLIRLVIKECRTSRAE